ncbi:MAG: hypothetical protein GX654_21200 [Desulfatiglans sp.]|nr:hypothetical protein [Desulfatiglans sp.]
MSSEIIDDICILCGNPAQSMEYGKGNGKAFFNCSNKLCGEYLITYTAIGKIEPQNKKSYFERTTTKEEIIDTGKILVIFYHGGIKTEIKNISDVLCKMEISKLGFK